MHKNKQVRMVQVSKQRWDLLGPKGNILTEGLYLNNVYEAELYVKAWVSSFPNWTYKIEVMK